LKYLIVKTIEYLSYVQIYSFPIGIWQPWTTTRGDYLNSGVLKYNQTSTSDLRDCMSFCLQNEDISYNCSSIVKSVSGDQCEIVNKRSDDTGVTPEVNTDY